MMPLRDWSATAQIALLFVLLFGALAAATTAQILYGLRADTDDKRRRADRWQREMRALWLGASVFWVAWLSGPVGATLLFAVFSFLALREFITLMYTRRSDHRTLLAAFFVVLPLQYIFVAQRAFDLFTVFVPVYLFLILPVLGAVAGDPQRYLERHAKMHWGLMVCVYGLSHAPALLLLSFPGYEDRGAFLVFFIVAIAAAAWLVQRWVEQHWPGKPVSPAISEHFGWRAWACGALASALLGMALFWITPFSPKQAFFIAFVAGGAGTLGEWVMTALKRDAGVDHWGNRAAVTGAGGLLDRIAPLTFAAPVFFHAARWYFDLRP